MAIIGLLFSQKTRVVIGKKDSTDEISLGLGGIVVDAAVSEEHLNDSDVTENPVEDGAKITDHMQIKSKQLTIDGVISDSPLSADFAGISVPSNFHNFAGTVQTTLGRDSRSIDAYQRLVALQEKREPFTVVTGLKQYKNMVLKTLTVPRTAATGKAIHFKAVLREIRIVKSKSVGAPNVKDAVKNLASKTKDLGSKVTKALPDQSPLGETPAGVVSQSKPSKLFELFGEIGS